MEIKELKVTVGEVFEGYFNDAEEGVGGYRGRLDIRPKYQREFVYKDKQRNEVIRTVMRSPSERYLLVQGKKRRRHGRI